MKTKIVYLQLIISLFIFCQSFCQNRYSLGSSHLVHSANRGSGPAYLSIHLHDLKKFDTLILYFWQNVLSEQAGINTYLPCIEKRVTKKKLDTFGFKIDSIITCGYISLSMERGSTFWIPLFVMDKYLIEPGDSIQIDIFKNEKYSDTIPHVIADEYRLKYTILFSGRGAAKYQCRYLTDRRASFEKSSFQLFNTRGKLNKNNHWDAVLKNSLSIQKRYKTKMSKLAYEVLEADFIGKYEFNKCNLFNWRWHRTVEKEDTSSSLKYLSKVYKECFLNDPATNLDIRAKTLSNYYPSYIIEKTRDALLTMGNEDESYIYYLLKRRYDDKLRDKLLTIYLLERFKLANNLYMALQDALNTVKMDYCLTVLEELSNSQIKGEPAYNFALRDTSGIIITLQDFKGKVIFLDFWFTGCHSCAGYYQYCVSEAEKEFENNPGVVFMSINVDRRKKMWLRSVYGGKYTSTGSHNVINLNTGGEGTENAVIKHYKISGYPTPLLIDGNGNIFCNSSENLGTRIKLVEQIKNALDVNVVQQ